MADLRASVIRDDPKSGFSGVGNPRFSDDVEATQALRKINEELTRRFGARGSLLDQAVTVRDLIATKLLRVVNGGAIVELDPPRVLGASIGSPAEPLFSGVWDCSGANAPTWNRGASTGSPWMGGTPVVPGGSPSGGFYVGSANGFHEYLIVLPGGVPPFAPCVARAAPYVVGLGSEPAVGKYQCDFHCEVSVLMSQPVFRSGATPDPLSDPFNQKGLARPHISIRMRPANVPDAAATVRVDAIAWSFHQLL